MLRPYEGLGGREWGRLAMGCSFWLGSFVCFCRAQNQYYNDSDNRHNLSQNFSFSLEAHR
jgi:hypothetical protein